MLSPVDVEPSYMREVNCPQMRGAVAEVLDVLDVLDVPYEKFTCITQGLNCIISPINRTTITSVKI